MRDVRVFLQPTRELKGVDLKQFNNLNNNKFNENFKLIFFKS